MGGLRYTLIALLLVGPGCAVQTEPEKRLPEGGALFGEAPPLLSVLSRLEGLM